MRSLTSVSRKAIQVLLKKIVVISFQTLITLRQRRRARIGGKFQDYFTFEKLLALEHEESTNKSVIHQDPQCAPLIACEQ